MAGRTGSSGKQRKTGSSLRWETPCCTYRYCLWLLAGCVRVGAPCFCFALNLLAHGFRLRFSNIPSDCHSESNRHSPAGIVDEISISTTTPWSMPSLCWVGRLIIIFPLAANTTDWCCTIKVDIGNSKSQYIEKDKPEAIKDGSESTKIQHGI